MSNTIVTTYGESLEIIRFMNDFCGKCRSQLYNEWYQTHEAFFVRQGVLIMDDLMYQILINDDGKTKYKPLRFCLKFDLSEEHYSSFSIINYYNQDKVASFRFIRAQNLDFKNIKVVFDYTDMGKFSELGEFSNPILTRKIKKSTETAILKISSSRSSKSKIKEVYDKVNLENTKLLLEYMCQHSVEMLYSMMYYYTKQKPQNIQYSSYFKFQEDIEYITKKETYIYKYTGYINLNDTKIYRTKINNSLFDDKKKEYDRHIESWTVRGHYRINKNGKKVWVKDYVKGDGVLENRIFGTKPESEVLLIPKLIECEREVRVSVKRKESARDELYYLDELMEINYKPEPSAPLESYIKPRYTRWQRFKILFRKISSVIFKNNKNEKHN
jgi:hypothetical protein